MSYVHASTQHAQCTQLPKDYLLNFIESQKPVSTPVHTCWCQLDYLMKNYLGKCYYVDSYKGPSNVVQDMVTSLGNKSGPDFKHHDFISFHCA